MTSFHTFDHVAAASQVLAEFADHLAHGDLTMPGLQRQRRRLRSREFTELTTLAMRRAELLDQTCRAITAHHEAPVGSADYFAAVGDLLPDVPDDLAGLGDAE